MNNTLISFRNDAQSKYANSSLNGFVKIISGLKAGDSVVLDGVVKISDGDIVEINSRPEKSNNVAIGASWISAIFPSKDRLLPLFYDSYSIVRIFKLKK